MYLNVNENITKINHKEYKGIFEILIFLILLITLVFRLVTVYAETINETNIKDKYQKTEKIGEIIKENNDTDVKNNKDIISKVGQVCVNVNVTSNALFVSQKVQEEQEKIRLIEEKKRNTINSNFTIYTDIHTYSGLTGDDIRAISVGYDEIYNMADHIAKVDEENKINAFFILGVLSMESGYCTSDYSVNYNNCFGMLDNDKPRIYANKMESVDDFLNSITKYYVPYGRNTAGTIQPKYEPRNNGWDDQVIKIMNEYVVKYNNL